MIRTLALTAALATAGLAHAQAPAPAYPPVASSFARTPNLAAPLNLKPVGPIELRYAHAPAPLPRGVARTAIERREGGVSGGVGVLCGIQPSADTSGVGTARGYDNDGRFVGAKLGFSF
ncbi:hypothetical protein [Caulobacter segnis]|uniref:Uncharacterized protein n=1 Tax=Caulobacter segnis TaxID=88688 RepID=A0A2W5X7C4_9CAUL|nr:hypothetical protein [Caulobacter segnis]PZR36854.1 MAG: hypothetical protein DI526_02305 [Caulobacter segnis]